MSNFYIKNRENLFKTIEKENSKPFGLILFSGKQKVKSADQFYPFTVNKNFFYTTGINEENLIFFAYKDKNKINEILFINSNDENKIKWEGSHLTNSECEKISGIKNIKFINEFEEFVNTVIFKNNISKIYLDIENRYFCPTLESNFANKLKISYPYIKINNIHQNLASLRAIKRPKEIEKIKNAIKITQNGIYSIFKNAKPNLKEYELEAYFDFTLKQNGVSQKAFETIIASGKNATILHYQKNNSKIANNSLVLLDLGATFDQYCADISRTFPVNGKFSLKQKSFYSIVLTAQQMAIDKIKENVSMLDLQNLVKNYYLKELSKLKMVSCKEDVEKYYYHNLGHLLGLDAHDTSDTNYPILKEGMVITIEPGLYIEEEGIGIRIEDNILVKKDGAEVLSKDIIKSVKEIEDFMKGC